jgi:hypothetical protein
MYKGKHDPPTGPAPVVRETGALTGAAAQTYERAVAAADQVLNSIVSGVNTVLPGGGGYHYDVGQGAYNAPVNGGQSTAPVGALYQGSLVPTGVIPGKGYVGPPIEKDNGGGRAKAAAPPKANWAVGHMEHSDAGSILTLSR